MNLFLFDDHRRDHFLPLAWTRPVAELRWGITTVAEKWSHIANRDFNYLSQSYLQVDDAPSNEVDALYVNARYYPTDDLIEKARALLSNEAVYHGPTLVAARTREQLDIQALESAEFNKIELEESAVFSLDSITDLFTKNGEAITRDIQLHHIQHGTIPDCKILGDHNLLFVGLDTKINALSINMEDGPIFIDDGVEIMEGSMLRGPLAICRNSTVKMGSKIYGDTTIGPHCKVGGEISNSNMQGYSNKSHDGFLGNSVVGQWCNLGADTNNSNLKNNYSSVRLYDYATRHFEDTGLTFCGLIMGDHSKTAINTQFNTGTVVGVHSNIFSSGFPQKFIPDFSWGTEGDRYELERALEVAAKVMARRGIELDDRHKNIYRHIFEVTAEITA